MMWKFLSQINNDETVSNPEYQRRNTGRNHIQTKTQNGFMNIDTEKNHGNQYGYQRRSNNDKRDIVKTYPVIVFIGGLFQFLSIHLSAYPLLRTSSLMCRLNTDRGYSVFYFSNDDELWPARRSETTHKYLNIHG